MKFRTIPSLLFLGVLSGGAHAADLISFWDKPERGGNSFNRLPPDQAYFDALQDYGASWVRLSYDKWQPAERDYLLGNADQYKGLVEKDLEQLKAALDRAHVAGLKVVITPLSLPGMRWAQNNGDRFDDRLWQDKEFWAQSAAFWRDLAAALKDHPAVAAYNLINEPAPEKLGGVAEHADAAKMRDWYEKNAGTARDLPEFYTSIINAIREVDQLTPVMVDAGWYAAADAFSYWPAPLADTRVLYSFHMYEPYAATSAPNLLSDKPHTYPGVVPFAAGMQQWDTKQVQSYLQQPLDWAGQHAIPANRLVAGEFGCMRKLPGCQQYLEDVLTTLEAAKVHWAFYSFREDSWDGMDYELGTGNVPWSYWKAIDDGQPDPVKRNATSEFEPISKRLKIDK
ncbi:glycosyl hydrolase [Pseudomonas versuta]|uniref:Glycosyl hydrolase n=1 Tax=Pseudomonas versuta TaxID=1788301 RepID=A0A853ZW52_9PSED|nr:cellulase family glycosylhydrolase [Pseudomonas versuta]OKA20590.1 glycosyl hydrolase [Pseudomonas versuta]